MVDKVTVRDIPDGEAGTVATLKAMASITKAGKLSPPVYLCARQLTAHLAPKDWPGEANALYSFVRDQIRYVGDPFGLQALQTPDTTLNIAAGNCAQKCILLGSLLTSINHPVQYCAVKEGDAAEFSHVVARTLMGDRWVWLETTEGPIPMGDGGPNFHKIVQPMKVVTVR